MRSLGDILPILVGDAHVVEADAVRPPGAVQRLVEPHEIDATLADVSRDDAGVEARREFERRAAAHAAAREPWDDLGKHGVEIAANPAVIAAHPVTEVPVDVAIGLGPSGEVPDAPRGDRGEVE